jgi:hypothetical protein
MPVVRQTSFASGELDPLLWGRTDLPAWAHGARRVRNFVITPQGAAMSRPGTTWVGKATQMADDEAPTVRLLPFLAADNSGFVLELGRFYLRVYQLGAQVPFVLLATPYSDNELSLLQYAQYGDTLTLTHPNHDARELSFANNAWTLAKVRYVPYAPNWRDVGSDAAGAPGFATFAGNSQGVTRPYAMVIPLYGSFLGNPPGVATLWDASSAERVVNAGDMAVLEGQSIIADGSTVKTWRALYMCVVGGNAAGMQSADVKPPDNLLTEGGPAAGGSHWILRGLLPYAGAPIGSGESWQYLVTMRVKDNVTGRSFETSPEVMNHYYSGWFQDTDAYRTNLFAGTGVPDSDLTPSSFFVVKGVPVMLAREPYFLGAAPPPWFARMAVQAADVPPATPDGAGTYVVQSFRFYRRRGPTAPAGFIGETATRQFVDAGDEPNFAIQPPQGEEPYGTATETINQGGPGEDVRRLVRPRAVAYFQQRRLFVASISGVSTVRASAVGNFYDFDRHEVDVEDEAVEFNLAARHREDVYSLLPRQRLLVLTGSSVWGAGGSQGGALAFNDLDVRVEDEAGATTLTPLVVAGAALYARAKGIGVRALVTDGQQYSYRGMDISNPARHLFVGANKQLVDWCYARDPWGLVWAARGDGKLLSATLVGETWAWAHHDTDGKVISLCSVPEGDEDAVYVAVQRTVNNAPVTYIERMTSRVVRNAPFRDAKGNRQPDPAFPEQWPDDVSIDCAITYSGPPVTGFPDGILAANGFNQLTLLEGKQVWVLARGTDPAGPFTVTNGELVDKNGSPVDVYDAVPETNAVSDAAVAIFVARVGLRFRPQLETLDIIAGNNRLRRQVISRVGFEVDNSVGLRVGPTFKVSEMEEWDQRDVDIDGTGFISAATAVVDMQVKGSWDVGARACLAQSSPRPVTVLGISRVIASAQEE